LSLHDDAFECLGYGEPSRELDAEAVEQGCLRLVGVGSGKSDALIPESLAS